MRRLLLLLSLTLTGCTHIRVEKANGTVVRFYCSKNVRADLVKIGEVEIYGLRTDASGPVRARVDMLGEAAKAATMLP